MMNMSPTLFTKLLIPLSLSNASPEHDFKLYAQWARRTIKAGGEERPLWETLQPLARLTRAEQEALASGGLRWVREELSERLAESARQTGILADTLVPNFRKIWGLGARGDLNQQNFILTLSREAREELFAQAIIKGSANLSWGVKELTLVISPDGACYISLLLVGLKLLDDQSWAPRAEPISRALARETTKRLTHLKELYDEQHKNKITLTSLGQSPHRSVGLLDLIYGLLSTDQLDDPREGRRDPALEIARRAYLFSSAFLDPEWLDERGDLSEEALRYDYCWRRAYPSTYLPPRDHAARDSAYAQRQNRRVSLSREGALLLTWRAEGGDESFDRGYPRVFLERYSIMLLHILIEEQTMRRMSQEAVQLLREAHQGARRRQEIKTLVERMVAYNISMNMLTCSDISEYQEFYHHLRSLRLIDQQRDDLSQGIDQLYEAVETSFRVDEDDRNRWINIIGLGFLPISLVTGMFGMNNFNAELFEAYEPGACFQWFSWGRTLLIALCLGGFLALLFWRKRDRA
jgi:hypothetical protein